MNQKISETPEKAMDLANQIMGLDNDILSVEIVDEPGHSIGSCIREEYKRVRTASSDVWRSISFQQALFFSGRREASSEEIVVIDKNEYQLLLRSPEQGITVVAVANDVNKSVADILALVEGIRNLIDRIPK